MKRHALTVLAAVGGLVLFGYAVRRAGVTDILDGIRQVSYPFSDSPVRAF
jgi:hypothetical protein